MSASSPHLGDSHNFGRRVTFRQGRVHKPRTVFWEQLTLGAGSPLMALLDRAAALEGWGDEAFAFIPRLRFWPDTEGVGGEVERLSLAPLEAPLDEGARRALSVIVGRSLALWSWLGVSDLHWENLALGLDERGRIVFGPLDVELILADLALPTETKLLADADPEYAEVCRHAAGLRRVLAYLGKPVAVESVMQVAQAYVQTLDLLQKHASAIATLLEGLPGLRAAPIRVCLRGTGEYVQARSRPLWPPLLAAESEQLERGDIPYFFRLYGRRGIHYYSEPSLEQYKTLPMRGDAPQLEPLLSLEKGLVAKSRTKLLEEGLFTLIGAFDTPSFRGRHALDRLSVTFGARTLRWVLPSGEELEAKRDLSAFVGSLYLPCACGEVLSVLVPNVTDCRPAHSESF